MEQVAFIVWRESIEALLVVGILILNGGHYLERCLFIRKKGEKSRFRVGRGESCQGFLHFIDQQLSLSGKI